ncbi:Toxin of toxin-antitoxin system [Rickettsia akari str. Hartford]|uniref:Toxin of toxin-antitoxin system n=1 Tax=Rickettsia akari (strain Hartford) TaxID=293614 RepID=A8GPF7_RICAH|nr:toxin of toxin-antitoxin system [Rickettsia akari]ABV75282.1 Toxin of toxin-antitoxin system [Rickettsia akari str. Hartford]
MNTARTNNLTSYYATYLLTAMHAVLPVATNDKALIKACHNNGVPLLKENHPHFLYNTVGILRLCEKI